MPVPKGRAAQQQASGGFNFGELSGYSSGGGLPEGDYIITGMDVMMYQATKRESGENIGPSRLGVMITLLPLPSGSGEERTQFYSLGSNADKSWAPNPVTGKGIVPVPGGPGTPPNASTNWAVLVKSFFDSGLPQGVLQDDLSVMEGSHVHMANVPEPSDRKGFKSQTGEAAQEDKGPKTISVVTSFLDDGKPWEGTGGVPEATPAPAPAKGKAHVAAKAAAPAPAPASDDVEMAATTGISAVLEKCPKGCKKLLLRTGTFKAVNAVQGADMAQKVINEYFGSDDSLNSILNPVGYKVAGTEIVAA